MTKYLFSVLIVLSLPAQAKMRMAITIDDLPVHGAMPKKENRVEIAKKMLGALQKEKVPEVYGFINAGKLESDPKADEVLKLWVSEGYPLGNHTYAHKSINDIDISDFKLSIDKNEKKLQEYSGKYDWKYFRYPFLHEGNSLERRNAVRSHLKENGYRIAQVTVDFEDWAWNEAFARCADKKDHQKIQWLKDFFISEAVTQLYRAETISKSLFKRSINHILLLHVGAFDAEMMEDLLKVYKKEGVEFIPLSEAVKDDVYAIDPGIPEKWGSEFTFQIMNSRGLKHEDVGLKPYPNPKMELKKVCL